MITKLYEGEEGWIGVSLVENELYFLHTEIEKWSPSYAKRMYQILVDALKQIPAKTVYSIVYSEKAKKFNELFGFEELGSSGDGTIMELENVWFK